MKYVVTNTILLRTTVMTALQPSQSPIFKELVHLLEKWKALGAYPNIVQMIYIDQFQRLPLIFTEYLPSKSLKGKYYYKPT